MRNRAIQALGPWITHQHAKDVVFLAKKYRVLHWLKDGYTRILQPSTLTAAELSKTFSLDWETVAKLLSAKMRTVVGSQRNDISLALEHEFKEEFLDMSGVVSLPVCGPIVP